MSHDTTTFHSNDFAAQGRCPSAWRKSSCRIWLCLNPDVVVRAAEFAALTPNPGGAGLSSLDHLLKVTVTISAELGRATRPIGEVLKYGMGTVVEVDRTISEPVELFVQGVRIARGEVVVVDESLCRPHHGNRRSQKTPGRFVTGWQTRHLPFAVISENPTNSSVAESAR